MLWFRVLAKTTRRNGHNLYRFWNMAHLGNQAILCRCPIWFNTIRTIKMPEYEGER
jgi:hypothetical protein